MRAVDRARKLYIVGRMGALALVALAALAVSGAAAKSKTKPKLPHIVYIRFQLSQSFERSSPSTGSVVSTATIDEVQAVTPVDLRRDTIIPAFRLRSARITARIVNGNGTCDYTGKRATGAEPEINLRHAHHKIYGLIAWPDLIGGNWQLRTASSCPSAPSYAPLQGLAVLSSPSSAFNAMDRFDNAVFPITVPRGQHKIKVKMSSEGTILGETVTNNASGLITISYGRCPSGLKRCNPTNGKP